MRSTFLRIVSLSVLTALASACGGESGASQTPAGSQDAAASTQPEASTPDTATEGSVEDAPVPDAAAEASADASIDATPEATLDCIADFTTDIAPVIDGLLYMSESDYPFEVVAYPDAGTGPITPERMLELLNLPADTTVEQRTLDEFFTDYLLTGPDGARYTQMRQVLEQHLTGLTVIRVGQIQIQVMLVGRTKCGEIAGLQTVSVET